MYSTNSDNLDLNIVISKFVDSTNVNIFVFLRIHEFHERFVIDVNCVLIFRIKNVFIFFNKMNNREQFSFVNIVITLN